MNQSAVFSFLADPATHHGAPVTRIDTHSASVFLAGNDAYKMKHSVRFPFLDYSTLERRHGACLAELRVNRAFAPQIYKDVIPVTQAPDGGLAINGSGPAVEWLLKMRRFDESKTLDHIVGEGRFSDANADALARLIAKYHRTAPITDTDNWLDALSRYIDQTYEAFKLVPEHFKSALVDQFVTLSRVSLERIRIILRSRGHRGLVRRCHGDLHLGNCVMIDGLPQLFDAIEFDETIASGDVMYDLAFLLMDLIKYGARSSANIILNRYLMETATQSNYDGLAALPLFMAIRAAIRAQVIASRLPQEQQHADQLAEQCEGYFTLALSVLHPPPPVLIAIGGLSGTGKSTIARLLAPSIGADPGAIVLRSDIERKALAGVAETQPLPTQSYTREATNVVYDTMLKKAGRILDARHSALTDAVYAEEAERREIESIAQQRHVTFRGLFLMADVETRIQRIGGRVLDASDATAEVARRQETYELRNLGWIVIDAGGTIERTLAQARLALGMASPQNNCA